MALAMLLSPGKGRSADLGAVSDALENLADMSRAADRANEAFKDAVEGNGNYRRHYGKDWYEHERRMEKEREKYMSRVSGVNKKKIRKLRRQGLSWGEISRRYDVEPPRRHRYGPPPPGYHYNDQWGGYYHGKKRRHHDDDDDD